MKFRCTYCGKPHERNDPPCDNCGHSEFEKAVVPMAPEAEDEEAATTYVWVCTECGNDHPKNTPPCDRCGGGPLERREQTYDEAEVLDEMLGGGGGGGPSADVSYLDVLDAKLVLGFVGVGALVVVLALGFLGVVTIPGISPPGPVPGNATSAGDLSLSAVERAYLDGFNERRTAAGGEAVATEDGLRDAATYVNQERVRAIYADGDGPSGERVRSELGDACGDATLRPVQFSVATDLAADASAYGNATELAEALLAAADGPDPSVQAEQGLVGVDVHFGPDGRVFVTQLVC